MVIRFAELEEYNNKTAMEAKVLRLEHAFDLLDEQMAAARQELLARDLKSEEDSEVSIPNSGRKGQKESSTRKSKINKSHEARDYIPTAIAEDIPGPNNAYTIQQRAPSWGLPRVSQRNLPLSTDYNYPNAAGEGVDVYVIDTGINIHHIDFEGRVRWGTTTVPEAPNTDDNGHGTFVAGVIGSRTFGVAKKVNLIAVKGLNHEGTGTLSQILAALDWVIKQSFQSTNHRTVVNLSLGAGYSKVLNSAVDTLVQSGLFIVVAAGNGNEHNIGQNACEYSPASSTAFTVGSTNINDQMSSFSNYGQCVKIYAPGERVRSTWIGPTNREIYTDSGTSFSAPNVAGIAALVMSTERGDRPDGSWSPKNIGNKILQMGTRGVVRNFKGPDNTNIMAFNGVGILGVTNKGSNGSTSDANGELGKDNGSQSDGHSSSIPSMSGGHHIGPHLVSGSSSSSSSMNHGLTLSVIHVLTVLATLAVVLSSL
ncbi:MAG: peptidase S8/S53 domain-containing protein [Benniella sp.]|nr:MAG: peptidase S8/S53 domain-containing protein [Benniella sp.]